MNKKELESYRNDVLTKTVIKIAELKMLINDEKHITVRPKSDLCMKELLEIMRISGENAIKSEKIYQPTGPTKRPMIPGKLRRIRIETLNQANHINNSLEN